MSGIIRHIENDTSDKVVGIETEVNVDVGV